jgi:hypothetical protein
VLSWTITKKNIVFFGQQLIWVLVVKNGMFTAIMSKSIKTEHTWGNAWRNERGQLHRKDGPAVEYVSGTKEWWKNGKQHRLDGPSVVWADGTKEWRVNSYRVYIY